MKLFIILSLLVSFSLNATVYVEIRESRADITTAVGEAYLGSYLYAMVSASSVHTAMYFDGDVESAIEDFTTALENERGFSLSSIKYQDDALYALLVDEYCLTSWEYSDSCYYPVVISRL